MFCENCGTKFVDGAKFCLNCGSAKNTSVSAAVNKVDAGMDPAQTAKSVTAKFGVEILADKSKFLNAFSDLAPKLERERKILKAAFDENIHRVLLDAAAKSEAEKEIAVKKSVAQLSVLLSEQAAVLAVSCLVAALDWNISVASVEKANHQPTQNYSPPPPQVKPSAPEKKEPMTIKEFWKSTTLKHMAIKILGGAGLFVLFLLFMRGLLGIGTVVSPDKTLDLDVIGVSEVSAPLSVSGIRVVEHKTTRRMPLFDSRVSCNYTIIATLRKNSDIPEQGIFEFSVALVDANGIYIDTIELPPESSNLFSKGDTSRLEIEFSIKNVNSSPKSIEFFGIREWSLKEWDDKLFRDAMDSAEAYLTGNQFDLARASVAEALKIYPDNIEAQVFLEGMDEIEYNYLLSCARSCIANGNFSGARSDVNRALQLFPESIAASELIEEIAVAEAEWAAKMEEDDDWWDDDDWWNDDYDWDDSSSPSVSESPAPSPPLAETPPPNVAGSQMATYRSRNGYSLQYPSNIFVRTDYSDGVNMIDFAAGILVGDYIDCALLIVTTDFTDDKRILIDMYRSEYGDLPKIGGMDVLIMEEPGEITYQIINGDKIHSVAIMYERRGGTEVMDTVNIYKEIVQSIRRN
jgi:tetratricopeptide (TPR) repeat protein